MTDFGVAALPHLSPEQFSAAAAAAEGSGLDQLWLWDDHSPGGGIVAAATVLAQTERIRVGLVMPLRNDVELAAMEVATLRRLHRARVLTGFGHDVQEWMGQAGTRVTSPMTLMDEYFRAMRRLLNGRTVTMNGRYVTLQSAFLDHPPKIVPLLAAAVAGPQALRLSGKVADATILSRTSPDGIRTARRLIDEGRRKAGRTDWHPLIVYLLAATGDGAAERIEAARRTQTGEQMPDSGVAGDADTIAATVRRLFDAGAYTVVLEPTVDDPDPVGFIRFAGTEIRPLLG
jgi:alkanesulfonate monooxygenase SsuD/methylene tetrahydromethanopterin reductase-like flavin-dependent oxidoreductase (luciferase family)